MTFLNVILLGGLAAASIPIIIHLLNRHRYRVVKWGAMHLLEAALRTNRRRLRLEQLILLLVRCLVPAVLALCMARPVLTGALQLVGAAKTSLVVLLDNSYSMEAGAGGGTGIAQAREAASRIIEDLARGSDVSVVLTAGGVSTLLDAPTFDTGRVNQELAKLDAGYGKATFPEALEMAAGIFGKMTHSHRELVVISDLQRISWAEQDGPARVRALQTLRQLPLPPQVTLMQVGHEVKDNVSVESLDYSRVVLGVGQPMQLRANLHNWGERDYPDLRVYFRVDGKERSASQISLGAGEQRQVLFSHVFDTAGSHVVEVYADADALKADNSLQASIPVWDRVPVLLVNGDPSREPLKGETDFLEIALQPFGKAKKADLTDLITTRVVTADTRELTPDAIAKSRVVVLANVRQLTESQVRALNNFVHEGGGLLIFPGNHLNTQWYNSVLADHEALLPMPLATLAGGVEDSAPHAKIVAEHFNHPALEIFNDPRSGNLADGEIKLWYKTKSPPLGGDSPVSVMARLDSGDPFLIERKSGEGRVIQCTTPCDADWSNLPVRPFYLPLMQRLVTYLASTVYPPRNVEVGKPLGAFLSKADVGKRASITDPAGQRQEVPVVARGTRSYVEFNQTQRPGLYLLTAPDESVIHFVVNTSREESNLQLLSNPEQESLAKSMDAELVHSAKEFKDLDHSRRFGREIWRPLLWLLLALIFTELLLQQWFSRRRNVEPLKASRFAEAETMKHGESKNA